MLVIIRLSCRNRLKLYYFGLLPVKKPFIALEIEIRTLPFPTYQKLTHHLIYFSLDNSQVAYPLRFSKRGPPFSVKLSALCSSSLSFSSRLRYHRLFLLHHMRQSRFEHIHAFVKLLTANHQRHQNAHDVAQRPSRDGD